MSFRPPEGLIPGDMESLKEHMPNFGLEQFIMPFLAHALGTLVGAWLTAMIAASHQMKTGPSLLELGFSLVALLCHLCYLPPVLVQRYRYYSVLFTHGIFGLEAGWR